MQVEIMSFFLLPRTLKNTTLMTVGIPPIFVSEFHNYKHTMCDELDYLLSPITRGTGQKTGKKRQDPLQLDAYDLGDCPKASLSPRAAAAAPMSREFCHCTAQSPPAKPAFLHLCLAWFFHWLNPWPHRFQVWLAHALSEYFLNE